MAVVGLMVAGVMAAAGCTPPNPAEFVVGEWKGDNSPAAVAARSAKLRTSNPDASAKELRQGAQALGTASAKFSADQTFELAWHGGIDKGTWTYDANRNEVVLTLDAPLIAPDHPNLEEAKTAAVVPRTWIALLDVNERRLELFMVNQVGMDLIKDRIEKNGKDRPLGFAMVKR